MSQNANESMNPAWKPLLDAIPEAFHGAVLPQLKQWDQTVQDQLEKAREPYAQYKVLADNNVPIERINEVFKFVNDLESNPAEVVKNVIDHWNLDYVPASEVQAASGTGGDPFGEEDETVDITKHPEFQKVMSQLDEIKGNLTEQQQRDQEQRELQQFQQQIDDYLAKPEHKAIPKDLLLAYMSQGYAIDDAAKAVLGFVTSNVEVPNANGGTPQAPVVMGGSGTTGSGLADTAVDYGAMRKGEVNDIVLKALEANAQANAQG